MSKGEKKEGPPDEAAPADFSDDEDENPTNVALNKQALLEWLTIADFTQEISLTKIIGHKFKLDQEELTTLPLVGIEGVLKICKV